MVSISCEIDCKGISEMRLNNECLIVVKKIPDQESVVRFKIIGKSITTGKDTVFNEQNRWFCHYLKNLSEGDTIIKRKGELTFNIHKKDTILSFPWRCNGKVYTINE